MRPAEVRRENRARPRPAHDFARIRSMNSLSARTAPWKKSKPKTTAPTKLTARSKARAKAAAKRAGRRYPNLIDNMNAARQQRAEARRKPAGARARPT
jgi:hypothetical protein